MKEYVVIDPIEEYFKRFLLDADGMYGKCELFGLFEVLAFKTLEGTEMNLWDVFESEKT